MRKAPVIVTALALCLLIATPVKAQATLLRIEPHSQCVYVCDQFTIDLVIEDVVDLYAWEIWMSFDPTLMEYINTEEGPFLREGAFPSVTLYLHDDTAGTIHAIGAILGPGPGVSGSGTLANITFHCSGLGGCILGLYDTTLLNTSAEVVWGCLGDADLDGNVDFDDLLIVIMILDGGPYDPNADFDGNGIVDLTDLVTVALNYGNTCPGDMLRPLNNVISHSTIDSQVTQATPVYVDVKPGSWPNPLKLRERGVLPLAVCGTEDFDVTTIDPETVRLTLENGIGVAPLRWSYEDVATPYTGQPCNGHNLTGDGYLDLSLKFKAQEVITTLGLDDFSDRDVVIIILTGFLKAEHGGTPIRGQDCIVILDP